MKHIFLSYSSRDSRQMSTLRENLIRIGYRPWVDPNPRPGQDWRFVTDDAIYAADAMMVVVTPSAADSVYVTYEWSLALGVGIPVIPIIFKEAKMHPRLQTLEQFDYTAWANPAQFWDYFTREIQRILAIEPQPQLVQQQVQPLPQPVQPQAAPAPSAQEFYTRSMMPQVPGYYVVVRRGPRKDESIRLTEDLVSLGRDKDNDIVIDDSEVSRHHLRFTWMGDTYGVEDLRSTNGTRINGGKRISTPTKLSHGQALMLGDEIILTYEEIPGQ